MVRMISATAFAAVMFPSCAARPVSRLVLMGKTITGALIAKLAAACQLPIFTCCAESCSVLDAATGPVPREYGQ